MQSLSKHASQWCQTTSYKLHVSDRSCFVVVDAVPSRSSVTKMTQCLFSWSARSFEHHPLCLSNSPLASFLRCGSKDWLMPTKATTFRVKTPLLSCIIVWCFYSWDNGGIRLQNDSTNRTSRTMKPRLHNVQETSQPYQLRNAHKDVHVGRVAVNKNEYCNPNHFNIPYFRNPKPFVTFQFHIHAVAYLDSYPDHFVTLFFSQIWIGWQWEPKLSLYTTYPVLFVNVRCI